MAATRGSQEKCSRRASGSGQALQVLFRARRPGSSLGTATNSAIVLLQLLEMAAPSLLAGATSMEVDEQESAAMSPAACRGAQRAQGPTVEAAATAVVEAAAAAGVGVAIAVR